MTNSTPEQEPSPETQAPTPSSGTDAGEVTAESPAPEASPAQAASAEKADPDEVPSTEQLQEPSTEKAPGEEPKAPQRDEAEPDHEAVGIGVIDTEEPQAD